MFEGHEKHIGRCGRLIACLLLLAAASQAGGSVQNLARGTSYDSINAAIADANDGDILVAAPGTYQESVSFAGKAVTLRSQNPEDSGIVDATVIDGDVEAVSFTNGEDANSVLAGFTLTGATRGVDSRSAAPTIRNCRIVGNADAGVRVLSEVAEDSHPLLVNCIIAGNGGAGIEMAVTYVTGRPIPFDFATIDHCTIVGNRGGGIDGAPTVTNSIIRANGPGIAARQIGSLDAVRYSNLEGALEGEGNIDVEPGFVEPGYWIDLNTPAPTWVRGNYHLLADSPCIDAGDPNFVADVTATDIDGHARVLGGRTDMGCDEVPVPIYLTWLGHASVRVAWKDIVVYVDPYRLTINPQDADLILVSHSHADHYSPSDLAKVRNAQTQFVAPPGVVSAYGSGKTIAPGQTLDVAGVRVTGVASYNIGKTNHPKANNWLGFIIEIAGTRIYCAGDTDLTPEMKALTDIDVAFLPAGGTYTMTATEAAEATKHFQPLLAIPYHWGTSVGTRADADRFATLAACKVKVMTPGEAFSSDEWFKDYSFLAHWKLDETQGPLASDSVGDYDAMLVGGPLWQPAAGQVGGAILLDGVDDCITTPFILTPSAGQFSVIAWVKGGGPGQVILSQTGGASWLMADAAGHLATGLKQSGRNSRDLISAVSVMDGAWHRIAMTWDGASRVLYVDGAEAARDTQSTLIPATTGLRLGGGPNAEPSAFWSGWIDDIRIYSRVIVP